MSTGARAGRTSKNDLFHILFCSRAHLPPTVPPTSENPSGSLLQGALFIDEDWSET